MPPPGLVPIATVMLALLDVTVLPPASWTVTVTAGVIATPATVFVGCVAKASLSGAPKPRVTVAGELIAVQVCQIAVTVYV